jgi:5-methylcytosine-specific restriction endonuclease McrA
MAKPPPRRHRHHLVRTSALAVVAGLVWARSGQPAGLEGLAGCELGFAGVLWLMVSALLFFAGPAWYAALVTANVRAGHRHKRKLAGHGRPAIPAWLRRHVYAADSWRCVHCGYHAQDLCTRCGKTHSLQIEHVRPFSRGGLTAHWNCVSLCGHCNVAKSDYWVYPGGRVFYHGFKGADNPAGQAAAAAVMASGMAARHNPLRLARLYLAHLAG